MPNKGFSQSSDHRSNIATSVAASWGTTRPNSVYICTADQLRAVPLFKRPSNALFRDRALEEAFILEHVGKSQSELQEALSRKFNRNISIVATYNLIRRYGVDFVGYRSKSEGVLYSP